MNWINLSNTLCFKNCWTIKQILSKYGRSFQQGDGRHFTGKLDDRTICPNCWVILGAWLQSIFDCWAVLWELWDGILEGEVDSEIQGKIIGFYTQMQFFFLWIQLGVLALMHIENLSSTLQYTHISCYKSQ